MAKAKWPTRWLMTDERMGDRLFDAIGRLPAGAGIIFRHHALGAEDRERLGRQVAAAASSHRLVLGVSRDASLATALGAMIVHNPVGPTDLPFSRSIHSVADARDASGAALAFVSPLHATRSHPGAPVLEEGEVRDILGLLLCPAIALGGMDEQRFADRRSEGFYGWAGIDAWLRT